MELAEGLSFPGISVSQHSCVEGNQSKPLQLKFCLQASMQEGNGFPLLARLPAGPALQGTTQNSETAQSAKMIY